MGLAQKDLEALSFVGMTIDDMKPRDWAMQRRAAGLDGTITASRKVCGDFAAERIAELAKGVEDIPSSVIDTLRSIDPKILQDFKNRGLEYEALIEVDF